MEPSLSHQALGAVFCPHEAVVEPWLVPMGYAESARLNGVEIQTGSISPVLPASGTAEVSTVVVCALTCYFHLP